MAEVKTRKTFSLIIVRHGEGFHNLGTHTRDDLEFTDDERLRTINSTLTEKGLMQASLVADRLRNTKFDLAFTSDLKRARLTAEAIKKKNDSIKELISWKVVRERCLGDFEGAVDLYRALRTVENAVSDRSYLTWRPPNGESVQDLRDRVLEFLVKIQMEVSKISVESPIILVSSHGLFMDELYYVISSSEYGQTLPKKMPGYQNTGIVQYTVTTRMVDQNTPVIEKVECPTLSCANHLENYDENYVSCRGGCHGLLDDQTIQEIDGQPR